MTDAVFAILYMTLVVGVAAGVLWLVDELTVSRLTSLEDRKAFVVQRTARWQLRYRKFFAVMVAVSVPINLVSIVRKSEPLMPNAFYIALAFVFLLSPFNAFRKGNHS